MPSAAFAYRLRETAEGWSWQVVDRDGNTIEAGVTPDKAGARAAIRRVRVQGDAGLRFTSGAPAGADAARGH